MAENNEQYTCLSTRLIEALEFAAMAHDGQYRRGNAQVPYIAHPAGVGLILMKAGASEDAVIAGILHDVIEDTKFDYEDIEKRFGQQVADLVKWVTIPSDLEWLASKLAYLDNLEKAPAEAKLVSAADMLYNRADLINSMRRDKEFIKRNPAKSYTDPELAGKRIELIAAGLGEDHVLVKDLRAQNEIMSQLF